MNEIIQKLNISDYVFEIDGKDIYNLELKYSINETKNVHYKDGHVEEIYSPVICFEVQGIDLDENESWIYFEINMGLKELNRCSNKPINIIDKVSKSEAFIKRPYEEKTTFLDFDFPTGMIDDMYKNISSVWVSKLEENKFIFKICIPGERIFLYFVVNFNKNNE